MDKYLIHLITVLHILFMIFILITPFMNSNYFILLHLITIPFLILHWICNDNTCILTIIERNLRKKLNKDKTKEEINDDCFTCKLIEPVYDFNKNRRTLDILIYVVVISVWLISLSIMIMKYNNNEISTWRDLFRI
jgi:hypothetical protein